MIFVHVGYIAQYYPFFTHYRKQWKFWPISLGYSRQDTAKFVHIPMLRHLPKPLDAGVLHCGIGLEVGGHASASPLPICFSKAWRTRPIT